MWKGSEALRLNEYFSNKEKLNKLKVLKIYASKTGDTIKKLKKGKTYYVRARLYKVSNGKKVYSKWSSIKKVKVKK